MTQLSADLRKKEVALQKAQEDYDKIAWQTSAGMTSQAVALQDATIDHESALAAYEEAATAPASTSDLESARSSIQDAQAKLDDLLKSPDRGRASAEAKVAQARASLDWNSQTGPSALDRRDAGDCVGAGHRRSGRGLYESVQG